MNPIPGLVLACLLAAKSVFAAPVECDDIATTGVTEPECIALVNLYDATDGPNWIDSSNWKTHTAIGSWYGVEVAGGHVTRLHLHDNGLVGVLPSSLGNLSWLTWLFLDVNQLSGSIPGSLGDLSHLTHLVLGVNQLDGQIPGQLGNLGNLVVLALKDNQLSGAIPPELGNLANLRDLDFSSNQLDGPIPPELGSLVMLERMILTRNQLNGQLPDSLGNLSALKVLDLDSNQLSGFIPKALGDLVNIERLELALNQLTGPVPAELGGLEKLLNLDLYGNYLTGMLPPELGGITSLIDMEIHGNQLTGAIPDAFSALTSLQVFQVNNNQLDADGSGNALISPALQDWFDAIENKDISRQSLPSSPGLSLDPVAGLITSESGGSASFSVVLDTQPGFDVSVTLVSSDSTEGAVLPQTIVFTPVDWFVPQSVVLVGVNDNVADGNQGYTVDLSVGSADVDYDGMATETVSAINMDDDQAGITVYPADGLVTTEAGGAAAFQVLLNTQPVADVEINLHSADISEGVLDTDMLQFTPGNWDIAQTVVVAGVDDDEVDGDRVYSIVIDKAISADALYHDLDPDDVLVINRDSDSSPVGAGITVLPAAGLETSETGATASFTIVLDTRPGAEVSIGLESSDASEGLINQGNLVFTPENWDAGQAVTITGVDDLEADGDQAYRIVVSPPVSADNSYHQKFGPYHVEVTNMDDDVNQNQPGVSISPVGGLLTTEGGTIANISVVLNTQPAAEVTIGFASSDAGEGVVSPASLSFTPENWALAQAVIITGVADGVVDGDQPYTVITTSTSPDPVYDAIDPPDIHVTNEDINAIDVVVSPTHGLITSESGSVDSFSVRLGSRPQGDVTLGVRSSDDSEGIASPATLVFTAANWSSVQTVTITGQEDLELDGDLPYSIVTDPVVSTDADYAGLNPPDIAVINQDNDPEPGCSSPPPEVELQAGFTPGIYLCIGDVSIRSEIRVDPAPRIIVENGAEVHLRAPIIELNKGFQVEAGGVVEVKMP